jgi:hypothetical protein
MLPDEALLAIFDFCLDEDALEKKDVEAWQSLVHVCRQWRNVVFGSPRRLNLRLVCRAATPVGDSLDVWPPLPLVVRGEWLSDSHVDNIITVLEHSNRVCQIILYDVALQLERVVATMQESFPELTHLVLDSYYRMTIALPDSFLGGSAPSLRKLRLYGVPFPRLLNLLLSATHLVDLQLYRISHSGNLSPDALVTALSTLTSLRLLVLKLRSAKSCPNQASRRPPATRSLLPVINELRFEGVSEYLEDLVARINAPRMNDLVVFFDQDVLLNTPQFTQFVGRTFTLEALEKAHVVFQFDSAAVKLSSETSGYGELKVKFLCRELDRQVSSLKQFCTSCLSPLSMSEDLHISYPNIDLRPDLEDYVENIPWLNVLQPFPAVKNLYLCHDIAPHIGFALQEFVGGKAREVLPVVQNIFLEGLQPQGSVPEGIEEFIAARRLSGHPVTVSTIPLSRDLTQLMRGWVSDFDH